MMSQDFINRLDSAIAQYAVLNHPFYQAWNAGTLTNAQLQEYAKQYYQFEKNFPRYVSNVHANTENIAIRQQLLLNLMEEEQGEANHPELWLRFSDALGADRNEVRTATPYKETAAMEETFLELTRHGSTLQGVAALYGYESQLPEVSHTKIEGLKKFYGVETSQGLAFFRVHEEADQIHRQAERDMLASLITNSTDEETAIAAATAAAKAYYHMLTGVVNENHIECPM
ncbi:MAG: CADD family putative folate metabolism protein [bacterium]